MSSSSRPAPPRTASELLARSKTFLQAKGVDEWRLEAELLTAHALGLDRLRLFLDLERPVDDAELDRARELLVRRGKREPTAYILGFREFYGRRFAVTPAVLIPRPETELVVDRAREVAAGRAGLLVGDYGVGSGCLAVTLALELEAPTVVAADVSREALAQARANADAHGASVELVEGDDPTALVARAGRKLDLLVSNPPYVARADRATLAPEVRDHEPALALFSPSDDVDHWARRLLAGARELVAPGGSMLVELGAGRSAAVLEIAAAHGLRARVHADLARIPRVLEVSLDR